MTHFGQKCDRCLKCVRCSEKNGRNGSLQLTFWTPTGPYCQFLCGECAMVVRKVLDVPGEPFMPDEDVK